MRMIHIILLGLCGCVSAAAVDGAAAAAPSDPEQRQLATVSRMLTDPTRSAETKYDAATLLLGRDDQAATGILAQILADEGNPASRIAVARAVADMMAGREAFVDPLLAMLDDDDPAVRQAAAGALGTYTDQAVLARLAQRAADPDASEPTRLTAIEALSRRIEAESIETLIGLLESPQPTIRTAAANALQQLTGMRQFGADSLRWRYWWQANQSKPRQQWLADQIEALTRQNDIQQRHIAALTERLDAALRQLYATTADTTRQQALILELLRDTLPETRRTGLGLAARRVASSEPLADETPAIVRGLLDDDDPAVRTAAARLTADLKDAQAVEQIMERLADETVTEVRTAWIAALGALGDPRALDVLVETVATRPNGEANQAALAVERLVTKAPPAEAQAGKFARTLIDRYARSTTSDGDLRRNLLRAMRALNHPDFAEVMSSALRDGEAPIRLEAMRGLARLGVTDAADAIASLAADSDRGVRQTAIATLAELGNAAHVPAVLGRTHPDVESDPVVRRRAWETIPLLMHSADNDTVARLVEQLAERPDGRPCRIKLMAMLIDRLAADPPRQVAVRLQLAEALRAEGRPAEAADVLAEALPVAGEATGTVWLAWVDAMLAADDMAVLTALNDQTDEALFAAAVERLVHRLAALRDAGQDEQMTALTEAAARRLGERLTEAQQASLRSLPEIGATRPSTSPATADVAALIAVVVCDDEARRGEATDALLALKGRAIRPLLLRLREELAAAEPDSACQARLVQLLTTLAPELTGFDDAGDTAARLELVDRWIAKFDG